MYDIGSGDNSVCRVCIQHDFKFLYLTAAVGGDPGVARLLLRKGADINRKDKDGKTALMIATVNGHYDLVEALLENKADITIVNEVRVWDVSMLRTV